jgi:predicted transport protein
MTTKLEKAQIISIGDLPSGSERLIQDLIAEDTSILTLGKLEVIGKERRQAAGGRLDLLLQDESGKSWYEVEIQRGGTDPSHIIRTIEYWDRERRLYPDIRHTAVIVAEEINGRFFNVISLFNRQIPIIALKVVVFKLGGQFGVLFTKILDYEPRAGETEDAGIIKVDRAYWEQRSAPFAFKATEKLIEYSAKEFDDTIEAKYNKPYIGTSLGGRVSNFVTYWPRKKALHLRVHCMQSDDIDTQLDDSAIRWEYDGGQYPGYRLTLSEADIAQHDSLIKTLIKQSYMECEGDVPAEGDV